MSQEQQNKEYRDLLIKLYEENQKFLDKAILSTSILIIPLLLQALPKKAEFFSIFSLFIISLLGFCSVIILDIFSLRNARDGCDKSLDPKLVDEGKKLFDKAKCKDLWKENIFLFSLLFAVISFILLTLK